jgi:DNA-binding GntR family transcriptional regulator
MTRSTLAESVADVLRHAIFQGAYLSGERLVELTIAQEMNVSQNTAREALRLLE